MHSECVGLLTLQGEQWVCYAFWEIWTHSASKSVSAAENKSRKQFVQQLAGGAYGSKRHPLRRGVGQVIATPKEEKLKGPPFQHEGRW